MLAEQRLHSWWQILHAAWRQPSPDRRFPPASLFSPERYCENNATIHTGKDLKSKTRWDRDVLKVTTTESGAVTVESYSLAPDGTMMASVVRPEHKPITLFFQRQ